jgi:hypothetical protein
MSRRRIKLPNIDPARSVQSQKASSRVVETYATHDRLIVASEGRQRKGLIKLPQLNIAVIVAGKVWQGGKQRISIEKKLLLRPKMVANDLQKGIEG